MTKKEREAIAKKIEQLYNEAEQHAAGYSGTVKHSIMLGSLKSDLEFLARKIREGKM